MRRCVYRKLIRIVRESPNVGAKMIALLSSFMTLLVLP
jgi:hypothetical protein